MGESFTLRGTTYTGIIDDITMSEAFASGMSVPSEPIVVTFALTTFSPALALGDKITARSKVYVVRSIQSDEIAYTLHAEVAEAR